MTTSERDATYVELANKAGDGRVAKELGKDLERLVLGVSEDDSIALV
jgi:hypothetical protein